MPSDPRTPPIETGGFGRATALVVEDLPEIREWLIEEKDARIPDDRAEAGLLRQPHQLQAGRRDRDLSRRLSDDCRIQGFLGEIFRAICRTRQESSQGSDDHSRGRPYFRRARGRPDDGRQRDHEDRRMVRGDALTSPAA